MLLEALCQFPEDCLNPTNLNPKPYKTLQQKQQVLGSEGLGAKARVEGCRVFDVASAGTRDEGLGLLNPKP